MEYRAVGKRCAVDLEELCLSISREEALVILKQKGFEVLSPDIVSLARQQIGRAQYRRAARPSEAPATIDCSSFIKWLYGQIGIWLPRRTIQQRDYGFPVALSELVAGDLIFAAGSNNYYHHDPTDGVGHVGMATKDGMVIHATSKTNVIEVPLDRFIRSTRLRGARRYIPISTEIITLETPASREVEIADDIKWIILQSLPY